MNYYHSWSVKALDGLFSTAPGRLVIGILYWGQGGIWQLLGCDGVKGSALCFKCTMWEMGMGD